MESINKEEFNEWQPADNICEHLPDQLTFIDWLYNGHSINCYFKCKCGKDVIEHFSYHDREVS